MKTLLRLAALALCSRACTGWAPARPVSNTRLSGRVEVRYQDTGDRETGGGLDELNGGGTIAPLGSVRADAIIVMPVGPQSKPDDCYVLIQGAHRSLTLNLVGVPPQGLRTWPARLKYVIREDHLPSSGGARGSGTILVQFHEKRVGKRRPSSGDKVTLIFTNP